MKKWGVWAAFAAMVMFAGKADRFGEYSPKRSESTQSTGAFANCQNLIDDLNPVNRMLKMETELKRHPEALARPKVDLIASAEVRGYPYVNRYLTDLNDKDISHYFILREDYAFQDLSGKSHTIPAGFIWDGASIPNNVWINYPGIGMDVGNTRYSSALSEGLIHDFMYRDPRKFSKEEADDLLYVNAVRCGNANPKKLYKGVQLGGGPSYRGHKKRQEQGLYDVFTPEFYDKNRAIYQSCQVLQKPEVFDHNLQCKRDDVPEHKICHADSEVVEGHGIVGAEEGQAEDLSGQVGIRGWCKCGGRKDEGSCCGYGAILGASAADCPYVYVLCRRCGKCMRDSDDLIDVKVEEALQKAKHMTTSQVVAERKKSQDRLLAIPDGQIVFPGKCVCEKPDAIKAGGLDGKEFHVCLFCGRYYVPVNNTVPIGPTARKEMGLK